MVMYAENLAELLKAFTELYFETIADVVLAKFEDWM